MAGLRKRVARGVSVCGKHPLLAFYLLTLAITWSFWIPVVVSSHPLLPFRGHSLLLAIGAFGPSLSAIILTAMDGGSAGVRELLGRLLKWRVGLRWYLLVLFLPIALSLSAIALHVLLGGATSWFTSPVPWYLLPAYFLVILLFVGPLQEEMGWRGYALPILQAKRSALSASLILGVLWAFWHLPLVWTAKLGLPFFLFAPAVVAVAILFTWVYNSTRGSLLIILLFHAAFNFTVKLVPVLPTEATGLRPSLIASGLLWAAAIIVVIAEGPTHLTRNTEVKGPDPTL